MQGSWIRYNEQTSSQASSNTCKDETDCFKKLLLRNETRELESLNCKSDKLKTFQNYKLIKTFKCINGYCKLPL